MLDVMLLVDLRVDLLAEPRNDYPLEQKLIPEVDHHEVDDDVNGDLEQNVCGVVEQ